MQKDDQSSSQNKLESLLDKISSSGAGKSVHMNDSHYDKKQKRVSQLVESKK